MRLIWDQFHLLWERILFVCLFVCPKDSRLCLAPLLMLLIAQVSILLFTPYFSKIILNLQLQPQEFVTGSLIKCSYFCRLVEKTGVYQIYLWLSSKLSSYYCCSYRTSYILLYANYIVKWSSTYSGMLVPDFIISAEFSLFL